MTIALYPGSFDPVTNGHIDIAERAARLFPTLFIGIFETPKKEVLLPIEDREALFQKSVAHIPNLKIISFSGLVVDCARSIGASVIVRGLRMNTDFEYEFEMALMNRKLAPDLDVVCLMTSLEYQFLSSSLLKEIAKLGGNIDSFVPKHVVSKIEERMHRAK